ncbi:MAG: histidine phosphatase family protein [Alphaproteobacteria bacterium]
MARLYLVRHGHAAAAYGDDPDPGLSDNGRAQAVDMAVKLAALGPLPILVSPLRRCRETALPLEHRWEVEAVVEDAVAEVPSPEPDGRQRVAWLRRTMKRHWVGVEPALRSWRDQVAARLMQCTENTVVVSHFVAINAAVSVATGDDRVIGFHPNNCSVTVLETTPDGLKLVELGDEAETQVLV